MDFLKPRYTPKNRRRRIYEGKAKVLYEGPEPGTLIQHFKDDATAFNAKKHEIIDGKGVLTKGSESTTSSNAGMIAGLDGVGARDIGLQHLIERAAVCQHRQIAGDIGLHRQALALRQATEHLVLSYPRADARSGRRARGPRHAVLDTLVAGTIDAEGLAQLHGDAIVVLVEGFALGAEADSSTMFETLFRSSLNGAPDGGGLMAYNYLSGEPITELDEHPPQFARPVWSWRSAVRSQTSANAKPGATSRSA